MNANKYEVDKVMIMVVPPFQHIRFLEFIIFFYSVHNIELVFIKTLNCHITESANHGKLFMGDLHITRDIDIKV